MSESIKSVFRENFHSLLFLVLVSLVTAGCLVAVANNSIPLGVKGEWEWSYVPLTTYGRLWLPIIIFIGFLLISMYFLRINSVLHNKKKNEMFVLSILVFMAFLIEMGVFYLSRGGFLKLASKIRCPAATSYYTVAHGVTDIITFLGNYVSLMPTFPLHATTNPPGPIIFCWLIDKIPHFSGETVATVIGLLLPLTGCFTIFPLYYLGKEVYGRKVGLYASIMYAVIPSMVLFTPEFDQMYTLFAVSVLYFFYIGLQRQRMAYAFVSGLVCSVGLFMSFCHLVLLFMIGLLAFLLYINNKKIMIETHPPFKLAIKFVKRSEKDLSFMFVIKSLFSFIAGLSTLFYGVLLLFNLNILEVYQQAMVFHKIFVSGMTYSKWVFYNLYDFFIFVGIPLSILFCGKLITELRNVLKSKSIKSLDFQFITFLLTLTVLDVLGTNRGEVARIWMFLMPFVALSGASVLSEIHGNLRYGFLLAMSILQFIQVVVFKMFIRVL